MRVDQPIQVTTVPLSKFPSRPILDERTSYEPRHVVESFIVPLLAGAIESAMGQIGCPRPGAAVLDVGCGRQPFRFALEKMGYRYVGFDTQAFENDKSVVVGAIDSEVLPEQLNLASFDLIICTEVLEHVVDWTRAFHNLSILLATGGVMLITCPHFYVAHEEPYDFWRPTPNAVLFHAHRSGLIIKSVSRIGDAFDVLGTLLAVSSFSSMDRGLPSRCFARAANVLKDSILRRLVSRSIQRRLRANSPWYQSIIAILEKQSCLEDVSR